MQELTKNYYELEKMLVWYEGPGNVQRLALISKQSERDILRRSANIANFVMMIADNYGGLMKEEMSTYGCNP